MSKNPVFITPNSPIASCARKMLANNVGAILVKEKNKLLGIVTEKDIVEEVVGKELDIKRIKVKDIMTKGMVIIGPDVDLMKAVEVMNKEDVRRLPVISNDLLIGILTVRDVLRAQPSLIKKLYEMVFIKKK